MQIRGVFFVLGAAGGLDARAADGNASGKPVFRSSVATICSNAKSLLAPQATHLACTTWPLEKMS